MVNNFQRGGKSEGACCLSTCLLLCACLFFCESWRGVVVVKSVSGEGTPESVVPTSAAAAAAAAAQRTFCSAPRNARVINYLFPPQTTFFYLTEGLTL